MHLVGLIAWLHDWKKKITEPLERKQAFFILARDWGVTKWLKKRLRLLLENRKTCVTFCHVRNVFVATTYWLRCWIPNIQGSRVEYHWVAPRSSQPFILPRSIIWIPGISGNEVVKSKLLPRSGSVDLRQLNRIHKKELKFFKFLSCHAIIKFLVGWE